MNRHSVGLIVFGLTFCFAIATDWMLAVQSIIGTESQLNEPRTALPAFTGPLNLEPRKASESDNENLDETRIEYFIDEKRIGRRGKNRIEIRCFSPGANRFADIKFYSRTEYDAWVEIQRFRFEKDGVTGCDPIVEDFNNDGLKDFTFQSAVAARGANEVRKLFIYDKENDELVYIQNSEDYPNLAYNKKLNCVDAWAFTASTTTIFLRIDGDMLREFASVSTGLERIVTVTRKDGTEVILRREKMDPDNYSEIYRRFSTYNPPR